MPKLKWYDESDIFNARCDELRRAYRQGEITAPVFGAKLHGLNFTTAEIRAEQYAIEEAVYLERLARAVAKEKVN